MKLVLTCLVLIIGTNDKVLRQHDAFESEDDESSEESTDDTEEEEDEELDILGASLIQRIFCKLRRLFSERTYKRYLPPLIILIETRILFTLFYTSVFPLSSPFLLFLSLILFI